MVATVSSPTSVRTTAFDDFGRGLRHWRLIGRMAWQQIHLRYARSLLGPFWMTLSMAAFCLAIGVLFGAILGMDLAGFLPYLTAGYTVWLLLSGVLTESTRLFMGWRPFIQGSRLPYSFYVLAMVTTHLIVFAHNMVVFVVVAAVYGTGPSPVQALMALAGLAVIALNALWVGLLLGMTCARFRDFPEVINIMLQILFFLTPIVWKPVRLPDDAFVEFLMTANPFTHFVEIVRAPLLGGAASLENWLVVAGVTAVGGVVTTLLFDRYRARILYWC